MDTTTGTSPLKGRRFQKVVGSSSFSRDNTDEMVKNPEERCAVIKFPALERVEADEPNNETHASEENDESNHRLMVQKKDLEEESFERDGIVFHSDDFASRSSPGKKLLLQIPLPMSQENETNQSIMGDIAIVPPSGEFAYPSSLVPDNEESDSAADILLAGFAKHTDSPDRNGERIIGHDDKVIFPINVREEIHDNDISHGGLQSPTTRRNALHRLGRRKKKVPQKLTKLEPQMELDITKEKSKAANWTEKITKIASDTAEMAANAVRPLSPLKGRRGQKIERLHCRDESGDFQTFSLPLDATNEQELSSENSESLDNSMDQPILVWDTTDVTDPCFESASPVDDNNDFDAESYADTEVSAFFESDAPDGTVWVISPSGCIRHLELSFA
uniref:Uncharacterized protein n=1 Tax=Amphora coffeiformis TaxID=265554 RepID=A0A7S3P7E6_9STRA